MSDVAPAAAVLVTHGDHQLPIAPELDDSRLEARLGPLPCTSLRDGMAGTYRRFAEAARPGADRSVKFGVVNNQ